MRFEEAYSGWGGGGRLRQEEAPIARDLRARVPPQCRPQRGIEGLVDERLYQVAQRRAPVDEVLAATDQYRRRHPGWNAKHFYAWYKRAGGKRGYACVKRCLQEGKLIEPARKHAPHGKRRERAALVGMMLHQDGSRHEWFPDQLWDLIVTMDDATGEHTQAVFCGPRRLARYNRLDKSISYEQNLALCACVIWKRWR